MKEELKRWQKRKEIELEGKVRARTISCKHIKKYC